MSPEQRPDVGNEGVGSGSDAALDVLWVSSVGADDLHPRWPGPETTWSRDLDPDQPRPVHGTVTVEVRSDGDAALLRRLLERRRPLSITSSVGWSQRVLLTGLSGVETELQPDGEQLVVATYTWVAAASLN